MARVKAYRRRGRYVSAYTRGTPMRRALGALGGGVSRKRRPPDPLSALYGLPGAPKRGRMSAQSAPGHIRRIEQQAERRRRKRRG